MNISKINNISFKAQIEINGGKSNNTISEVEKWYNDQIAIMKNKKAVALQLMDYITSDEVQLSATSLPENDVIMVNTLLQEDSNKMDDTIDLIYHSENPVRMKEVENYNLSSLSFPADTTFLDTNRISKWFKNLLSLIK